MSNLFLRRLLICIRAFTSLHFAFEPRGWRILHFCDDVDPFSFVFLFPLSFLCSICCHGRGVPFLINKSWHHRRPDKNIFLKCLWGPNYDIMCMPHGLQLNDSCVQNLQEKNLLQKTSPLHLCYCKFACLPWHHVIEEHFTFVCRGYFCFCLFLSFAKCLTWQGSG